MLTIPVGLIPQVYASGCGKCGFIKLNESIIAATSISIQFVDSNGIAFQSADTEVDPSSIA